MESYQRLIADLSQAPPPPGAFRRAEAKGVRERAGVLPLADPARAAVESGQLLDDVLGAGMTAGGRIDAMECLRAPVAQVCAAIEYAFERQARRVAGMDVDKAAAAQGLQWKLMSGYALALHELCAPAGRLPRFKARPAAMTVVRGLVHAERVLAWTYRRYRAAVPGMWRCAHALYAFAAELGIAGHPVADALAAGVRLTPRTAYARLLLLAMSDPYRFSLGELRDVRGVIGCVAGRCHLVPAHAWCISFDPAADAGPGRDATPAASMASRLTVEVADARGFLSEQIAGAADGGKVIDLARPDGSRASVPASLLERLQAGWQPVRRGSVRLAAGHRLDLVIGMRALHFALAGNLEFSAFIHRMLGEPVPPAPDTPRPASSTTADRGEPRFLRGEVADQSDRGYRIGVPVQQGGGVQVGELVGLAPVDDDEEERDWMVGVIRWMREESSALTLGVELLRRRARAAVIRPFTPRDGVLPSIRGVELYGGSDGNALSLLMNHRLAHSVAAVDVVLPAFASNWNSPPTVARGRPHATHALAPGCFGVTLEHESEVSADAV